MSTWQTIALGAVAGFTIFLGLPLGRMKRGSVGFKTFLSGLSAGILVFLLFDVLAHATEPVEEAVVDGDWGQLVAVGLVYVLGLGLGLLSIPYFFRFTLHRARPASLGPGAMAVAEVGLTPDREALRLGMTIAAGIGLHNFSEGLAIGQAANAERDLARGPARGGLRAPQRDRGVRDRRAARGGRRPGDVGVAAARRARRRRADLRRDDRRDRRSAPSTCSSASWRSPRARSCT